jgi:hypothetical protein
MPMTVVDAMDNLAPWQALAPDGVTPSTEVTLTRDLSRPRPGIAAASGRIVAGAEARGHRLRRAFGGLDLTSFDELRLWINGGRVADGSPGLPFFLALRLGSAALAIDAPGNTWRRLLPVMQADVWLPVRLSIGDLPDAVRSAVTAMELTCVAEDRPFACNIDSFVAVREAMIADVDAALHARLDRILAIAGNAVPAVLHPAGGTLTQARPYIEITHYDIAYSPERTSPARPRRDFGARGYALRAPSHAYELFYQVTAVADDRPAQSAMLEFVLRMLPPQGEIMVNNDPLPLAAVRVEPCDQIGGARTDRIPLFYRVSARQEAAGAAEVVTAPTAIFIDGGVLATAP